MYIKYKADDTNSSNILWYIKSEQASAKHTQNVQKKDGILKISERHRILFHKQILYSLSERA